jgi:hypothetical protein
MSGGLTLFIADGPFYEGEDVGPSGEPFRIVEIRLRMAITEPSIPDPPQTPTLLEFVLDTGADYANVSPDHLATCGIPLVGPPGGKVPLTLADGSNTEGWRRDVTLWLYSNMPELEDQPFRIDPSMGVVVFPESDPLVRPLLGMSPLLEAGLRIDVSFSTRRFSVWVPD